MVNRAIAVLLGTAALFAFPGEVLAQCAGQPPANQVCASPNGAAGLPGFRKLVAQDFPLGTGTVTNFSSGNIAGFAQVLIATPSTTPAQTFVVNNQSANTFMAAPNGAGGAPAFRLIVPADVPAIALGSSGNGGVSGALPSTQVSGTFPSTQITGLGTAATQNTGTSGANIPLLNGNNNQSGSNTFSGAVNFTSTFQVGGNTITWPANNAIVPQLIARGTVALGTASIGSGACAGAIAGTASAGNTANILATDTVDSSFNGDPTGIVGFQPVLTGLLVIFVYPTAGAANFKVCNTTASAITPGAVTLNWKVVR